MHSHGTAQYTEYDDAFLKVTTSIFLFRAPKRTFKRIDELEAGHSTVDSMTIVTKESSSLPDEKSP